MTTFYPSPEQPRPPDVPARPFKLTVAPPPPSDYYRRNPDYVRHVDLDNTTFARALSNRNAWERRHSHLHGPTVERLAALGCLPELAAARGTQRLVAEVIDRAAQRVAETTARAVLAETALADALRQAVHEGGRLPSGEAVLTARAQLEAAQLVADSAAPLKPAAQRAAQQAIASVDWTAALRAAEQLNGPDATTEIAWLRAHIDGPGAGHREDPLRWI